MLSVGDGRPYPPTRLSTARWIEEVPVRAVRIDQLTTTQPHVGIGSVLWGTTNGPDPYPHVVSWRGRLYLEDGHGRIVRALLDGRATFLCRVLERETWTDGLPWWKASSRRAPRSRGSGRHRANWLYG